MASDMLGIPLRMKELDVYLLDAPSGEPIGDRAIGFGMRLPVPSFLLVLHEAIHVLVGQTIRLLSGRYTDDEHAEYIDEAIVNLITSSVLSRLKPSLKEKFDQTEKTIKRLVSPLPPYSERPETVEGREALQRHNTRNRYIEYYREAFKDDWTKLTKQKRDFNRVIAALLERNSNRIKHG